MWGGLPKRWISVILGPLADIHSGTEVQWQVLIVYLCTLMEPLTILSSFILLLRDVSWCLFFFPFT